MDAKIKWSMFIFHLIYCMSFGCEYVNNDCYYDIYCPTPPMNLDAYTYRNNEGNCEDINLYVNGYTYYPLRIKIDSKDVVDSFNQRQDTFDKQLIVSIEITNTLLGITPDFFVMPRLKFLNLSNNNFQVAKLFNNAELISLQNLDLSHNSINSILVDDSQYVYKRLQKLNLSHNVLTNIPGGIFEPFKFLEHLDLSCNEIAVIDHYSFEGLKQLKYLSLSHNNIFEINISLFRFYYLEVLYLDYNNIEILSNRDFEKLRQLTTLKLDHNKIGSLAKDTFTNTISLTTLTLNHNLLKHIHKDTFISTNSLKNIDLSNNLVTNLPKDLFLNKSITSFSIIENNLQGTISRGIFEGLQLIPELDISFQGITGLEEFAFFGLTKVIKLLLNNNAIKSISFNTFNTLICLKELDLSDNLIVSIDFSKRDLVSLECFNLGKNLINQILQEDLRGLNKLRFLDLSNNNISNLATISFKSIETIESLKIFNNPIRGSLFNNSFFGLHLVPILDLSRTLLTSIQNESFSDMVQLLELNISRSSLNKLEYSAFKNTGNLVYIDLSFNKLTEFIVNGNDIKNLTTLYLNNNAIFHISNIFFKNMHMLTEIFISYNLIKSMDDGCFADQRDLNYLDVSFNKNLTFHTWVINNTRTLGTLLLSGVKNVVDFTTIGTVPIRKLELSHLGVSNVSLIHLSTMRHLMNLALNNNNIAKIESSAFRNMSALIWIDLSFNNISFIQPGTFKDNVFLQNLNLSHNSLTSLNYGIFRGLITLNVLDISYNSIQDLGRDRFYDTQNLHVLYADHNQITNINEDLLSMNLVLLSIGHNPLSCEKVILLKERSSFDISAINNDDSSGDNIDGITCNIINHKSEIRADVINLNNTVNEGILLDIRNVLFKLSENRGFKMPTDSGLTEQLNNISNKIDKYSSDQTLELKNIKSEALNKTNSFLEKILKVILGFASFQNGLVANRVNDPTSNKGNATYIQNNTFIGNSSKLDALVLDVIQVKQELLYMENIISEIDRKISQEKVLYTQSALENLNKSNHVMDINTNGSFIFLEVCVSLILVMLVCFFLYKFYQAKLLKPSRFLITEALDNTNL